MHILFYFNAFSFCKYDSADLHPRPGNENGSFYSKPIIGT